MSIQITKENDIENEDIDTENEDIDTENREIKIEIGETSTAQKASIRRPDIGKRRADDSIFRAPAHMRYDRKKDFEPKLVSIGPYYHGQAKLEPMEKLKRQCVPYLLEKAQPGADQTPQLVEEFMKFERDARLFYKEKFNYGDVDFIRMLVNDSCFIIRVILSLSQEVQESMSFLDVDIKEVRSDLLLLENQIPLFFIEEVYTKLFLTEVNPRFPPFETVLEPFIWLDMPWRINHDGMSSKAAHLLDLYWRCSTSETLNSFGSCLDKVINEPLNNFLSRVQQAIKEPEPNIMINVLRKLVYDLNLAIREEETIIFQLQAVIDQLGTFQIGFKRAIHHELKNFFESFRQAVRDQFYTFQREELLSDFQDGIEQVAIEQLITFRSGFQKVIDEQRPLIHKEVDDSVIHKEVNFGTCGGPLARMVVPLNSFRSCFEQGRNEQLNNIQSDIEQEMNEQLNYLSIGFDQAINKQLDYLGRPGFQGEQPSLVEIYCPTNEPKVIANATILHQMAGIKFEKLNHEHHHNGLDVIFSNGIMQMPCLKIDSCQKTLLIDLIAYENSKLPSMRPFSSYIKLMDALIDSKKDVELLQQCGVISNTLRSHKMAATFFNEIGNFCLIDHKSNCFPGLYENVLKYYDSSWNRRRASLRQNYCSSPWAKISVFAGVTLLILTVIQTFFTMYAYFKPPKQPN